MSKKPSGLGRGLGDLLEDNAPELKSATVIRRNEDGEVSVSPIAVSYIKEEKNEDCAKPLVFPTVTPITGGSDTEKAEPFDAAEKISEISEFGNEKAENAEKKPEYDEPPRTRSLKAVFRNFK